MSYVTKCLRCKNKSMRPSSYYEISLNIKGHKSVEDCIGSYLSAEVLEGENKYFCEHCDSKQCAERFLELKPRAAAHANGAAAAFRVRCQCREEKEVDGALELGECGNMWCLLT